MLRLGDRILDLSSPRVMGILNVTPDSFHSGSRVPDADAACRMAESMLAEGADILDIGGYSTRPGAAEVPETEEVERVRPVFAALQRNFPETILSADTFRSAVAQVAVDNGASIVNDVTAGLHDPEIFQVAARAKAAFIVMHMRGTPATMGTLTNYDDIVTEVALHLKNRVAAAEAAGLNDIVVDPGFGFAKTADQNFMLLRNLDHMKLIGRPILAGLSRKSMVWRTLGIRPEEALNGTSALHMVALEKGASILRVHDVRAACEVITLFKKLHP